MKIGVTELIVIFIVALFVVGPEKLPVYARKLGEALAQFRKYSEEATRDIKESIVEPLEEAQRPLKEAIEPLTELNKEIRENVKDVQDSFAGIGKAKKEKKEVKETKEAKETEEAKESEASASVPEEAPAASLGTLPEESLNEEGEAPEVKEENTDSGPEEALETLKKEELA